MQTPIKFDFTLSVEDYKTGTRMFYLKQTNTLVGLVISGIFFFYGIILLFTGGRELLVTSLLVTALFPVLLYVYFVRSPSQVSKRVAQSERFTSPQKWRVDNEKIMISQHFGDTRVRWEEFVGLVESKDYFLLRFGVNRNAFQIVPKRAFSSEEQQAAFRELVRQNMGKGKK